MCQAWFQVLEISGKQDRHDACPRMLAYMPASGGGLCDTGPGHLETFGGLSLISGSISFDLSYDPLCIRFIYR